YNTPRTVLSLHGWQSVPGGVKPNFLARHGHEVINPQLPDQDMAMAVRIAQAEFDRHQPQVVVGSSRGGAVAMNISSGPRRPASSRRGRRRRSVPPPRGAERLCPAGSVVRPGAWSPLRV